MPKILVVDDEPQIREVIRAHLEMRDYEVVEAEDGQAALDLLVNTTVDLVVTDVNMPRTDGMELLMQVRLRYPKLPVVIITGKASIQAAVQSFKVGAADFLTKPLEFARLAEVIEGALARPVVAEPSPAVTAKMRLIGPYTVDRTLGTGTHGVVFLAHREERGRRQPVALKVLRHGEFGEAANSDALARFKREAEAASKVHHPHVVGIIDYGWADKEEIPYLAMEFVEGRSLKDLIIGGQATWDYLTKGRMLRQLASALAAIHQADLCHRDIKSQNVMVTADLNCKITDFGIVKLPESQLTQPDRLMGTPAYMAPEAFVTANTDARADLFSLGVLGYELFTGQLPFPGDGLHQVALAVSKNRPVEPRKLDQHFPKALQFILARLLKKSPDDRYPGAKELIADLDEWLGGRWPESVGMFNIFRTVNLARDWS